MCIPIKRTKNVQVVQTTATNVSGTRQLNQSNAEPVQMAVTMLILRRSVELTAITLPTLILHLDSVLIAEVISSLISLLNNAKHVLITVPHAIQ